MITLKPIQMALQRSKTLKTMVKIKQCQCPSDRCNNILFKVPLKYND